MPLYLLIGILILALSLEVGLGFRSWLSLSALDLPLLDAIVLGYVKISLEVFETLDGETRTYAPAQQ